MLIWIFCAFVFVRDVNAGAERRLVQNDGRELGEVCGMNEYVQDHLCVSCPPGSINAAGDDPRGRDTNCAGTYRWESFNGDFGSGGDCDKIGHFNGNLDECKKICELMEACGAFNFKIGGGCFLLTCDTAYPVPRDEKSLDGYFGYRLTRDVCTRPTSITGYDLTNVNEDLAKDTFQVSKLECAEGYSGVPSATVCDESGGSYTLHGCSQSIYSWKSFRGDFVAGSECSSIGHFDGDLKQCKRICELMQSCSALNYKNNGGCFLFLCTSANPVPPDDDPKNGYVGYRLTKNKCVTPVATAGYDLSDVDEELSRNNFLVRGVKCAEGYSGDAKATMCKEAGGVYTLSGCSPSNSMWKSFTGDFVSGADCDSLGHVDGTLELCKNMCEVMKSCNALNFKRSAGCFIFSCNSANPEPPDDHPLNGYAGYRLTRNVCVRPSSTVGYDFTNAVEKLARNTFQVSTLACARGYSGTPLATVCSKPGGAYTLSRCVRESTCLDGKVPCGGNSTKCIPSAWTCDGIRDCEDESDEMSCGSEDGCEQYLKKSPRKKCDGIRNCENGLDERNCENCEEYMISFPRTKCDGERNCANGADEENCGSDDEDCDEYMRKYPHSRCDGIQDCDNGEDEQNCDNCDEHMRRHPGSKCDGVQDCDAWEDEQNCGSEDDCDDFVRRHPESVCDGIPNCANGIDEANCGKYTWKSFRGDFVTNGDCEKLGDFKGDLETCKTLCESMPACTALNFRAGGGCFTLSCKSANVVPPDDDPLNGYAGYRLTRADTKDACSEYLRRHPSSRCDGTPNCENGDDERNCANCNDYMRKYPHTVCDGTSNCMNGADEDNCDDCRDYLRKHPYSKCDGIQDCSNSEDERDCGTQDHCDEYLRKNPNSKCDGIQNCVNGEDETNCSSVEGCNEYMRTYPKTKCNGVHNCDNGVDETNCDDCKAYMTKFPHSKCDGYHNCADGSDEDECGTPDACDELMKKHPTIRCDGNIHCLSGADEDKCENCDEYVRKYPNTKCDGVKNCADGMDEVNCRIFIWNAFKGDFVANDDCQTVGHFGGQLDQCKRLCESMPGCSAFNFKPGSGCVLFACSTASPVPPDDDPLDGYSGYRLTTEKDNMKFADKATKPERNTGFKIPETADRKREAFQHPAAARGFTFPGYSEGELEDFDLPTKFPFRGGLKFPDSDEVICGENEHVQNHMCVVCPPNSVNAAGDVADGDDTFCAETGTIF